eukprot:CAMPEP_0169119356 /NCGR_PEP_ID=MMETSP1015-20121227/31511_1 /TAXON_ID=342587 /ORGANISM="Karlodinium micrum, Strain CCMP2283" /LENGTH=334 /DNA_ID=CAMNT_0009182227 /DNA_START=208 /DNA_END=1212 /DNA_ORIENTATION=+
MSFQRTTSTAVTTTASYNPNRIIPHIASIRVPIRQRPRSKTECSTASIQKPSMLVRESLRNVVTVGDVLCIKGSREGLNRLGANGGFMGHVLLVVAPIRVVSRASEQGAYWRNLWPSDDVEELWVVAVMEICRAHEGIYETEYLIFADESGRLLLHGEAAYTGRLMKFDNREPIEVFQSPAKLRNHLREHIVDGVLAEMRCDQTSWSWSTAIRAFLLSADMPTDGENSLDGGMQAIEECWHQAPICTSLVIVFWQRYLCSLAEECNETRRLDHGQPEINALDWIHEFIPLKSDRALPGDLLSTLYQCGWNLITNVSQAVTEVPKVRLRARMNTL